MMGSSGQAKMRASTFEELRHYFDSIGHTSEKSEELARCYLATTDNVLKEIRKSYPAAELGMAVGPFTASDLGPFSHWIKVDTDAQRDALCADGGLMQRLEQAAKAGGWPSFVYVESQEAVDRDFSGSWFDRAR